LTERFLARVAFASLEGSSQRELLNASA